MDEQGEQEALGAWAMPLSVPLILRGTCSGIAASRFAKVPQVVLSKVTAKWQQQQELNRGQQVLGTFSPCCQGPWGTVGGIVSSPYKAMSQVPCRVDL